MSIQRPLSRLGSRSTAASRLPAAPQAGSHCCSNTRAMPSRWAPRGGSLAALLPLSTSRRGTWMRRRRRTGVEITHTRLELSHARLESVSPQARRAVPSYYWTNGGRCSPLAATGSEGVEGGVDYLAFAGDEDEQSPEWKCSLEDKELAARLEDWMRWDFEEESRAEVEQMVHAVGTQVEENQLREMFLQRLEFGTAGLRGLQGVGFNRMNHLTVVQATQGVWVHLCKALGETRASGMGVVIGFDARHGSQRFAKLAAATLAAKGCKVFLAEEHSPTPLVAWSVSALGCAAGLVITASHNPKEYNGYKVYASNGCQIIPPTDISIASAIESHLEPWPSSPCLLTLPAVSPLPAQVKDCYLQTAARHLSFPTKHGSSVVYTPLHGVGLNLLQQMFHTFNLPPPIIVAAQAEPDPEFPTVKFPNPEEGAETWQLALRAADLVELDLVLANDPDADRLAVATYVPPEQIGDLLAIGSDTCLKSDRPEGGVWRPLSGNEIGALLASWMWSNFKERNPDVPPEKVVMLASTVSSKMLRSMALKEGFRFEETLTGFKWLGNRARQLQSEGLIPLFAFEEAIGFMFPQVSCDKDGITAAAVLAQLAHSLDAEGTTFTQRLGELYSCYGAHCTRAHYLIADNPAQFQAVFANLRASPPPGFADHTIIHVKDLGTGVDSSRPDGKAQLPWSRGDLHICYTLEGAAELTLRASGTEPKLKYYLEVIGDNYAELSSTAEAIEAAVVAFLNELLTAS